MRIPPRLVRMELKGEYAGIWLDVQANPPMGVFEEMGSKDSAAIRAALSHLVRASNVEDEDGNAVDLHTVAGWNKVPVDFWNKVAEQLGEVFAVPKATSTESTTSSSGTTPAGSQPITPP